MLKKKKKKREVRASSLEQNCVKFGQAEENRKAGLVSGGEGGCRFLIIINRRNTEKSRNNALEREVSAAVVGKFRKYLKVSVETASPTSTLPTPCPALHFMMSKPEAQEDLTSGKVKDREETARATCIDP